MCSCIEISTILKKEKSKRVQGTGGRNLPAYTGSFEWKRSFRGVKVVRRHTRTVNDEPFDISHLSFAEIRLGEWETVALLIGFRAIEGAARKRKRSQREAAGKKERDIQEHCERGSKRLAELSSLSFSC